MFLKVLKFFEISFLTHFIIHDKTTLLKKIILFIVIIFLAKYFSENNINILYKNTFQKNR